MFEDKEFIKDDVRLYIKYNDLTEQYIVMKTKGYGMRASQTMPIAFENNEEKILKRFNEEIKRYNK